MDNNSIQPSSSANTDLVCDILIVIFIALFAYYILSDKFEGFSSEGSAQKLVNANPEQLKKKVSFEDEDLISNEPEHDILTTSAENTSFDEDEVVYESKPKKKSRPSSKTKMAPVHFPDNDPYEPNLTGASKSLALMNANGKKNKKNYSCDLLGLDSDDVNNFKKDYYGMYAHQIECPKNCHMNKMGTKKCDLSSDKGCNGVFTTDYNNPDVFALSYMSLMNNDKKPCVTCTENSTEKDKERLKQMKLSTANVNNLVDFNNNVNMNSAGETPVDKMAEIRSCETGTCNFKDFGKSIKNVYDNLVTTPVYTNRNKCDPYQLTGINENKMLTDNYAPYSVNN